MSGTNKSVKVTLRNPLDHTDQLTYTITVFDNAIARDWYRALKELLVNGNLLEKNFCFLGFPETARDMDYLCRELNSAIDTINGFFDDYQIVESYTTETMLDQHTMNHLHNHFEILQGTVENLSDYYRRADYEAKYAIRQLNNLCHEIESLILSQRKLAKEPEWVRPTQITTFLQCDRHALTDEHRQMFLVNGYNRVFGGAYLHWSQIGKTLFEVWRDEGAPELTATLCEAITHLQYYTGEFDVEWGNDVVLNGRQPWHTRQQTEFKKWVIDNGLDPLDLKLSLGYLPLGQIDTSEFGDDPIAIRSKLSRYLDIYMIEIDDVTGIFDYCWTDSDHKQKQIDKMKRGYDFNSRG